MAVSTVIEGEVANWVADVYSKHAGELGHIGLFLSAMQEWFEDNRWLQQAERGLVGSYATRQTGGRLYKGILEVGRKGVGLAREAGGTSIQSWARLGIAANVCDTWPASLPGSMDSGHHQDRYRTLERQLG